MEALIMKEKVTKYIYYRMIVLIISLSHYKIKKKKEQSFFSNVNIIKQVMC